MIFEATAGLVERNQACDAHSIRISRAKGFSTKSEALSYLGSLARDAPTAANIRAYADIVHECSLLRQLITAGNEILGNALDPEGREARKIIEDAGYPVFEIAELGSRGK